MSDSKLGAQARGQRNLVPEVLDKAPAGTELGWVVWVANPSSGGGGTVDQGKKGSSGESWYIQDGSGLLATAAKQDAGNASLAAIDAKLGSPLAVTGPLTNAELRAAAVPVSAASLPLPAGAATELTVASILGQLDSKTSTLATQVTAAATLAQLDAKTSTLATASAQTTGNSSLATIATQQTDGTQKTQVTSSALPTGAATAAKQPAIGTAGTPSADVLSVQGVAGGTPQPVSPQARSATPAASFVDASASSVTLLAANVLRKSASFFNNSNADLYLLETGGTADTTTGFTTVLRAAGGWHELPIGADGSITTGAITGIWASAGISGVAVCERV